jgi:hypothetical protein
VTLSLNKTKTNDVVCMCVCVRHGGEVNYNNKLSYHHAIIPRLLSCAMCVHVRLL